MKKRSALKIFVYILYFTLIVLFFTFARIRNLENFPENSDECENLSCVRFCGQASAYMNETSDDVELMHPMTNITQTFHFVHARPCKKMKLLDTDQWKFSSVSFREKSCRTQKRVKWCFLLQNGSIFVNKTSYSVNEYCLEVNEANVNETEHKWSLMVCDDLSQHYKIIFLAGE